jgi:hypothetical protein
MKPKAFVIEPYKDRLYLFCPCTKEQAQGWLKRKKIDELVDMEDYDETDAITFYTSHGNLMFMHDFKDTPEGLALLAHELCHVTFNVLHHTGVKEAEGTEEAAAYLLENLMEKCVKHFRSNKTKPTVEPTTPQ